MPTHKSVVLDHRGGLRFHAHPGSGHDLEFDDRESNQGGSPVETVLAALAACSAMDVISIATKKRQAIEVYRVHASGSQRDEYPQVYTEIELLHEVTGENLSEGAIRRSIELSATKYCPVNAMLCAGLTVVHHRYRIRSGGGSRWEAEGEVVATGPYQRPDVIV
ncbi:MAG: OsmC family protein [Candidatus Limnocylindrales bacterium]